MRRYSLTLELPQGSPPGEFRIFPFGLIETTKGRFQFDRQAAERVMAAWRDYGNQLSIDYEHQALDPVANGPVPAAGWFDLELRADGLWAVRVQWTERAQALLAGREYRYFSPAFYTDEEGRIVELINLALTNIPATKGMTPLVARALRAVAFAAGPVLDTAWDANAAEARVRRWASSDGSGDKDTIDWAKYRQAFAWYDPSDAENFGSYKLPHHDVQDGRLYVHRRGVIAVAAALQGARGGVDLPSDEKEAVMRHIASHYHQWDAKAPWEEENVNRREEMTEILRLLGLRETASEAEAGAAITRLTALERTLTTLTGRQGTDEALAVVQAWRQAAEELPRVQTRLEALEAERRAERMSALIERGKREGKLTPAMLSWAEGQSLEALEAFLAVAPRVVPEGASEPAERPLDWNKLSAREKHELYTQNVELYRRLRKEALGY